MFSVLILATAEQVRTTQLFNLYRFNLNLLLPDVPLMAHGVLLFKLIKEIRQWHIEDLARGGWGGGTTGFASSRSCVAQAQNSGDGPRHYTFRRNRVSIMKI